MNRRAYRFSYVIGDQAPCRQCGSKITISAMMKKYSRYLCPSCSGKQRKVWEENHHERALASARAHSISWAKRNPEKRKAEGRINHGIENGRVVRPTECHRCGNEEKIVAHHPDYTRQDWVIWLCRKCHLEIHKELASPPRQVSRAGLESTIERVSKMNLDEFMKPGYEYWSFGIDDFINLLRELGLSVDDGQEKGREG